MQSISLDETIQQLGRTPATLSVWLADLSPAAWQSAEAPGAWCPFEVLCHLLHAEDDDWVPRIRILLQPTGPRRFTSFNREGGMATYGQRPPQELLDLFATKRRASLAILAGLQISSDALARTAVHPELGEVTLDQLLACWVTHDLAHTAQIARGLVRYHGDHVGPWRAFFRQLRDPPKA
jgi:hypothetical protein